MSFRLSDKWVWDFWFAQQDRTYHMFYLQAPRSLGAPALRHHNATVGHASSGDLKSWVVLPDALLPGPDGAWDDLATWTGSAIADKGRWYMLYTGINRAERGLVQRIGLAASDDLVHWEKHPGNPVLEAEARWYETLQQGRWHDQSWRDPCVFWRPEDSVFHVLVTARSASGPPDGAGVLAHARSNDLVRWEVLPPLVQAGEFAQVEVPQLLQLGSRHVILFSCLASDHSNQRMKRLAGAAAAGTFAWLADDFFGPYSATDGPLVAPGGPLGVPYAGKILQDRLGSYRFMAFRGGDDREFQGELTDLFPVRWDASGNITVLVDHA